MPQEGVGEDVRSPLAAGVVPISKHVMNDRVESQALPAVSRN